MGQTLEPAGDADSDARPDDTEAASVANGVPRFLRRVPRIGIVSWSFIGFVVTTAIIVVALSAVSSIILPFTFAAVLAVCFKPFGDFLVRHKFKPALAAGLIVLCLLAVMTGVVVATVKGVTEQTDEISASADAAIDKLAEQTDAAGVDQGELEAARSGVEASSSTVKGGVLEGVVEGFSTVVEIAGGLILGALIMYYLLKDGTRLRRSLVGQVDPVAQDDVDTFVGDACRILRDYGKGRSVMSAIVSLVVGVGALLLGLPLVFTIVVVNFIGGYIPYIGAFLGGGLAVIIALGDGGIGTAAIMLLIVLASNLALENFVEPKVMGRTLDIHPLVVLIVTALGGLLGGIVGLILAVPAYVIAGSAIKRLRARGVGDRLAERAKPTVESILD